MGVFGPHFFNGGKMKPIIRVDSMIHPKYGGPGHYIGRAFKGMRGSPLGNPFSLKQYERADSVARYKEWLREQYKSRGPAYEELMALYRLSMIDEGITLLCWCKHLGEDTPCHGDVIKYAIESLHSKGILPE
jgi:hypothetical protein